MISVMIKQKCQNTRMIIEALESTIWFTNENKKENIVKIHRFMSESNNRSKISKNK